jgi:hypothetical protein
MITPGEPINTLRASNVRSVISSSLPEIGIATANGRSLAMWLRSNAQFIQDNTPVVIVERYRARRKISNSRRSQRGPTRPQNYNSVGAHGHWTIPQNNAPNFEHRSFALPRLGQANATIVDINPYGYWRYLANYGSPSVTRPLAFNDLPQRVEYLGVNGLPMSDLRLKMHHSSDPSDQRVYPAGSTKQKHNKNVYLRVRIRIRSGQFVTTIRVAASSVAVAGALITVQQSGVIVAWGYYSINGTLALALNAGTYTVSITAIGFTPIVASNLVVSGDSTVIKNLTPSTLDPPTTPNTCRVQIKAMRGAVPKQVRVVVNSGETGRKGELAFMQVAFDGLTDIVGAVATDLPWSSTVGVGKYRFRFFDVNSGACLHDRTCTNSDVLNAQYEDLQ